MRPPHLDYKYLPYPLLSEEILYSKPIDFSIKVVSAVSLVAMADSLLAAACLGQKMELSMRAYDIINVATALGFLGITLSQSQIELGESLKTLRLCTYDFLATAVLISIFIYNCALTQVTPDPIRVSSYLVSIAITCLTLRIAYVKHIRQSHERNTQTVNG